jgi:sortase A
VTDRRRFLLLLLSGLLFFSGMLVVAIRTTEPATAASDSPALRVAVAAPVTTTTTTLPSSTTTSEAPVAAAQSAARSGNGPTAPPRDPYVPEPIREIGTIEIPKIGLNHRVMEGVSLRNIDLGPSHWPGTALPGQNGNAVFAGHRVTHTHPFRNIDQLVEGDDVFFTIDGIRSHYVVVGHEVVSPSRVDIVNQTATPTATLFACHPPGSARQRYVVHLALVPTTSVSGDPAAPPTPSA